VKIPRPFLPVELQTEGLGHVVRVVGREIRFGENSLPESITVSGTELLAAPIRLVGTEDGEPIVWETDYATNECEPFIQHRADDAVTLCGCLRSFRFVADTCITVEYDGMISIDLKLATRGMTVPERYGLQPWQDRQYRLDRLWLEIPLKRELASHYSVYPGSGYQTPDGGTVPDSSISHSGRIPAPGMLMPFKGLCWYGNEDMGLGFFAENERNWQPADSDRVLELIPDGDVMLLRVHLLDSHPAAWKDDPTQGLRLYEPVSFRFGLQPTPVKPFPEKPYLHRGLHLDCFIKVEGNYRDFLDAENRFDRLVEKGVTTLILHEKWNRSQNSFDISETSLEMLSYIVRQCHKRGIRVLPYFGYEIASMDPEWHDHGRRITARETDADGILRTRGGWYRFPAQRAYVLCYNTDWRDRFIACVEKLMDECHIDGVYLDGTMIPWYCENVEHGCGWYDDAGKLRGSYPILAVRETFRRLYDVVDSRGGMINVHLGSPNFTALGFAHLCWYGEAMQTDYVQGGLSRMPLDHFRAAYTGRNMGVPAEFIAYENRPIWTFENALAMASIHGILPRPNDIEWPLDLMAEVWKTVDAFPTERAAWLPYWKNAVKTSDERVLVSYYRYEALDGSVQCLAFCSNTSAEPLSGVTIDFPEPCTRVTDRTHAPVTAGFTFDFEPYSCRILYLS